MKRIVLFLAVLLTAFCGAVGAQTQTTPAILGIHLGQSPQEVRPLLEAIGQAESKRPIVRIDQINWTPTPGAPGSIAALHASVGKKGGYRYTSTDFDEYVQVGFGQVTQKAFYVVRAWGNDYRDPTLIKDLESALIARYGKPHSASPGLMQWAFKADNTPATLHDSCMRAELTALGFHQMTMPPSPNCGFTMSVRYVASNAKPDVVFVFGIGMYDHRLHIDDIRTIEQQDHQAAESRSREVQQKLGGKKPTM